jgi:hypothetical protein
MEPGGKNFRLSPRTLDSWAEMVVAIATVEYRSSTSSAAGRGFWSDSKLSGKCSATLSYNVFKYDVTCDVLSHMPVLPRSR